MKMSISSRRLLSLAMILPILSLLCATALYPRLLGAGEAMPPLIKQVADFFDENAVAAFLDLPAADTPEDAAAQAAAYIAAYNEKYSCD